MPILIKGSGGAQEPPTIGVLESGLIAAGPSDATSADEVASHQLSSADDADFVAENIKSGITIFGVTGTYCETVQLTVVNNSSSIIYVTAPSIGLGAAFALQIPCAAQNTTRINVTKNALIAVEMPLGGYGSSGGLTSVSLPSGTTYTSNGISLSFFIVTGAAQITKS